MFLYFMFVFLRCSGVLLYVCYYEKCRNEHLYLNILNYMDSKILPVALSSQKICIFYFDSL